MRLFTVLAAFVAAIHHTAAQAACPPTVTITADAATWNGITSSSYSHQIVYTTEFQTTVVSSNGIAVVETMTRLLKVVQPLTHRLDVNTTSTAYLNPCADAVTVTIAAGLPFPSSELNTTSSLSSIADPLTSLNSTSPLGSTPTPFTGNFTSTPTGFNSTTLPISSLTSPTLTPSISTTSGQTATSNLDNSTQSSFPSSTTAASSFGVALNIWSTPTPTLECAFPCQLKMPCMSLASPTTITFPPYTTTLCKAGCSGSVQMKTKTVITLPVLTTDSVCFYPMSATGEGPVTPVPRWITDTRTIDAPKGLSTCPPVFAKPDANGKCGADNHYMCQTGQCCSENGKCGFGKEFCDKGCQLNYGNCWSNSTSCEVPAFEKSDDTTPIPIFPVLYDDDFDVILPPILIAEGFDLEVPVCKKTCGDVICGVLGCDGECGILSCSSIDLGWFKSKFPKTDCHSAVRRATCALFNIGCCPEGNNGDDDGCTIDQCTSEDDDEEVGINGDTKLCDPDKIDDCGPSPKESEVSSSASSSSTSTEECSSTTTVQDQTAHCIFSTDSNGKTSTSCTSTATGSPRQGCSIQPSTITSFTSGCSTQTASHVTNDCTVLTGAGNDTRTECTSKATTFSGCDVTGITTTSAVTECSNSNTVTNITSSCFATNITSMGSTFPGSGTCTGATSTVFSGCDLSGAVASVTSYAENVCEFVPNDITIIPITPEPVSVTSPTNAMAGTTASTSGGALDVLNSALAAATSTATVQARWWRPFEYAN